MKRTWRFWLALWAGKAISKILKLTGRKGTTLPGNIALQIEPNLISILAKGYTDGIIIVTGTNGKTTTANLLASILKSAGKEFAFNQAGANLVTGITSALIANTTVTGRLRAKMALLEVDEANVPKFCQQATPDLAIVTNFFRDQLDRFGELETIIKLVQEAIPAETNLVLNADDPLVAQLGKGKANTLYYGLDKTQESKELNSGSQEVYFCPFCGEVLQYELFHYGQLGKYSCIKCDYKRPDVSVLAEDIYSDEEGQRFRVESTTYTINVNGYYNLYNALAALATAKRIGIKDAEIERGLREFVPQAGRMERFQLPEGKVTLTLVKNPTCFNQVLQTLVNIKNTPIRLAIAINDLAADGRDVSWIWDVNFEILSLEPKRIDKIICSGSRAEDMAVRLKYASIPVDKIKIEHDFSRVVAELQEGRTSKELAYIMSNYTALFSIREVLIQKQIVNESDNENEELDNLKYEEGKG